MAQKIQTFFIDDLDGSEAEGTVLFGLDGTQYEIDLSTGHAKELWTALARYIEAGRRVTGTTRRASQSGRKAPANGISNTEVRAWAKTHGLEIKERGRVSADILAQYRAATGS
jgi:Lsr2